MGETTDEITRVNQGSAALSDEAADGSQEAAQIRLGIEQTRSHLSETIEALQEKLDPSHIAEQVKDQIREKAADAYETAKNTVKEATLGRAEKIMATVSETVNDVSERAGTAVRDTSSSLVQYARENPIPLLLVGVGIGMLAFRRENRAPVYNYARGEYVPDGQSSPSLTDKARTAATGVAESAREAAGTLADNARSVANRASDAVSSAAGTVKQAATTASGAIQEKFSGVSEQARQGAQTAGDRFMTAFQDNPIAVGLAAVAAGALVGLSLPATRLEGEYMGEARDRLVSQAKTVAQDAAEKVQRVAGEAGRKLQDAAQKEGFISGQPGSPA